MCSLGQIIVSFDARRNLKVEDWDRYIARPPPRHASAPFYYYAARTYRIASLPTAPVGKQALTFSY